MKTTKHLFLTFIACMAVMLSACSDEDGPTTPGGTVPDNVLEAFNSQYPNASNVSWEIKSDYAVASFTLDATRSNEAGKNKAWYRMSDARWSMRNSALEQRSSSTACCCGCWRAWALWCWALAAAWPGPSSPAAPA